MNRSFHRPVPCTLRMEKPLDHPGELGRWPMNDRRLHLDKQHAKLGGVCAGIADYFDWNVTFVRIGWLLASILIWPLIIVYILMWLLLPGAPDTPARPPTLAEIAAREAKVRFAAERRA